MTKDSGNLALGKLGYAKSDFLSLNTTIQQYEQFIGRLERSIRESNTKVNIGGNFTTWHRS